MSAPRKITPPPAAVMAQNKAADPRLSAWVAANAGSGKTYVLSRRVVRLMLSGAEPGAILCLTFTKAAAATMANRVFKMLSEWVMLDDAALSAQLEAVEEKRPDAARLAKARRLFARALETPGGLKVQTIHAFCERVLHQFPFEANVPSHFTVLDDGAKAKLLEEAKLRLLAHTSDNPNSAEAMALQHLSARVGDLKLAELLNDAMKALAAMPFFAVDDLSLSLQASLGLLHGETPQNLESAIVGASLLPPSEWKAVAGAIRHASTAATDLGIAAALEAASPALPQDFARIFLTKDGRKTARFLTRAVEKAEPALFRRMHEEGERQDRLHQKIKAARLAEGTTALLSLANHMRGSLERLKAARGLLDFDDLIDRTRDLMQRIDAAWVLYKLDQGIDHILVDEAQDTSPAQWELVRKLAGEFAAGAGARGALRRTLFVVGDEKQSIYSFQGADPLAFDTNRRHFETLFVGAQQPFERITMTYSFRSTPRVLAAVDGVFDDKDARKGLSADEAPPRHEAARRDAPGLVELWPLTEQAETGEALAWTAPVDAKLPGNAETRLAQRIAAHISLWLRRGESLPDKDRPVRPGDILILVKRRSSLFAAIIRALKSAGVPVAGADRMKLASHIAVMDLMALGDCLVTPDDDLSLAALLKSPFFGLDDIALEGLCHGRQGSLWEAVTEHFPAIGETLAAWRKDALSLSPARFYGRLLARDGGRRAMLRRFGMEAADAIDEFMAMALAFESRHVPTLGGFLALMRAEATEVKRDMDLERDEVRVMTVHGSKGLEADIVFLADTMSAPSAHHDPRLFHVTPPEAPAGAPPLVVWSPSATHDVEPVATARAKAREGQSEEYRRLLYVAMTRAADKLVICGVKPKRMSEEKAWYDLVSAALQQRGVKEPADDGDGDVTRWGEAMKRLPQQAMAIGEEPGLPDWLLHPAPPLPPALRPVMPSRAEEEAPLFSARMRLDAAATAERAERIERGLIIHRLLQSLPETPLEQRRLIAERFLSHAGMAEDRQADILKTVFAMLEHPEAGPLFAPDARAEVSLSGHVRGQPVAGQIDRLAVGANSVIIADFKTGAAPPTGADIARTHVTQMALYRDLIAQIFPDKTIRALLVYAQGPCLITVPDAMMDAALAALAPQTHESACD